MSQYCARLAAISGQIPSAVLGRTEYHLLICLSSPSTRHFSFPYDPFMVIYDNFACISNIAAT